MADIFTDTLSEVRDFSYVRRPTAQPSSLEGLAKIGQVAIEGGLSLADRNSMKNFQRQVNEIEESHRQGYITFEDSLLKLNAMTRTFAADRPHLAKEARGMASAAMGVDINEQLAKFELTDIEGDAQREQRIQTQIQDTLYAAGIDPATLTEEQQRHHALRLNASSAQLALLNSPNAKENREDKAHIAWIKQIDAQGGALLASTLNGLDLDDPNAVMQARTNLQAIKAQLSVDAARFAAEAQVPGIIDKLREVGNANIDAVSAILEGNIKFKKEALEQLQTQFDLGLGEAGAALMSLSTRLGPEYLQEVLIKARTKNPEAVNEVLGVINRSFEGIIANLDDAAGKTNTPAQQRRRTANELGAFHRGEAEYGSLSQESKATVVGNIVPAAQKLQTKPDAQLTDDDVANWVKQSAVLTEAAATVQGSTKSLHNAMKFFNDPTWHRMLSKAEKAYPDSDNVTRMGQEVLHTATNYIQRVGARDVASMVERAGGRMVYDPVTMEFKMEMGEKSLLQKSLPNLETIGEDVIGGAKAAANLVLGRTDKAVQEYGKLPSEFNLVQDATKALGELNQVLRTSVKLKRFDPGLKDMTDQQAAQLMAKNAPNVLLAKGRAPIKFDEEKAVLSPNHNAQQKGLFSDEVQRAVDGAPVGTVIRHPDGRKFRKTEGGIEEFE